MFFASGQHSWVVLIGRVALLIGVIFCFERLIIQNDDAGMTLLVDPAHEEASDPCSDPHAAVYSSQGHCASGLRL